MTTRPARLGRALLAGASIVWIASTSAATSEQNVIIQGFEYRPAVVQVAAGDTVAWTNLDGTVHTVTAADRSFDSGRLGKGQRYILAFNEPGEYHYFCTLHEHEGTVVVEGANPAATTSPTTPASTGASTTTATLPSPPTSGALGAGTPTTSRGIRDSAPSPALSAQAAASVPPSPASPASPAGTGNSSPVSIVAAPNELVEPPMAPPAVLASVLALAGAAAMQVTIASRRGAGRRLQILAGALTFATAVIHLQVNLDIAYPEPVSSMFVAHGLLGLLIAGILVADPGRRPVWLAVPFHAASLGAFVMSRTVGMFGFREAGWDPSPQAALAVACELAALGVLALAAAARTAPSRTRGTQPSGADLRFP